MAMVTIRVYMLELERLRIVMKQLLLIPQEAFESLNGNMMCCQEKGAVSWIDHTDWANRLMHQT